MFGYTGITDQDSVSSNDRGEVISRKSLGYSRLWLSWNRPSNQEYGIT